MPDSLRSAMPPPGTLPAGQPVDLGLLADLPTLPLRAKYLAESYLIGRHRSPLKGSSVEFTEYRPYMLGDDLRHVDWRYYARTDNLAVKQYEEETQLRVYLVLDASSSMAYRSRPGLLTKLDFARVVLAASCLLARRQQDAFSVTLADSGLRDYLPPRASSSHFHHVVSMLDREAPGGPTDLGGCLLSLAELMSRRSLVIIASDFYDQPEGLEEALRRLRYDRHDIIALHVLDPMEVDFDADARAEFVDMETGEKLPVSTPEMRAAYLKEFRAFQQELSDQLIQYGADYQVLRTDEPPTQALGAYLAHRNHFL